MDRWKWVVIDVGVVLDTPASHSENFFFRHFSELGGGPLGHSLGCHQNFDIFSIFGAAERSGGLRGRAGVHGGVGASRFC